MRSPEFRRSTQPGRSKDARPDAEFRQDSDHRRESGDRRDATSRPDTGQRRSTSGGQGEGGRSQRSRRSGSSRRSGPRLPRLVGAVAGVTGRHVSALTVVLWCGLTAAVSSLGPWATALVIACAAAVLALGWAQLTRVPVPLPAAVVTALAGATSAVVVLLTRDLSTAPPLLGLAVVALAAVVLLSRGAPLPPERGTSGDAPLPPERGMSGGAAAASSTVGPPADTAGGLPPTLPSRRAAAASRPGPARAPLPSLTALPAAVVCLLVAVGGSVWVSLAVRDQWSPVVPLSCLLCSAAVLGDQLGGSFRSNSFGAVGAGALTGTGSALALELLGLRGASPSALLPGLAHLLGGTAAAPVFGLFTGVAVALAVIAVDGLLGDHLRRSSRAGAIARGTAKFLVAVLPIYALIRVGGI